MLGFAAAAVSTLSYGLMTSAMMHDVQVGGPNGLLQYSPESIMAQPGDQVIFHFNPKNHTVTQTTFASPCGPVADGAIDSGFHPVMANMTSPTFTVTVNDTKPLWFYCKQAAKTPASHCGQGMVFAINAPGDGAPNSYMNFKNAALKIGDDLKMMGAAAASSSSSMMMDEPTHTMMDDSPMSTSTMMDEPPMSTSTMMDEPPMTTSTMMDESSSSSMYYSGMATSTSASASYTTAAYGGYTISPAPSPTECTQTVTVASSTWTTTYASYPGSPDPTPSSLSGSIINVKVGADGLMFSPQYVVAKPRDTIVFEFHAKNHTVTQSAFDDPCRPLASGMGFDSSFMPVGADVTSGFPTWNYTVQDTTPVWAYCKQKTPTSHCGQGMVFAINPPANGTGRSFGDFQGLAKQMNGTSNAAVVPSSSFPASAPSATPTSGAGRIAAGGAGVAFAVAAVVLGAML